MVVAYLRTKKLQKITEIFKNDLSKYIGKNLPESSANILYLKFCCISHKNLIDILHIFCHFMIFSRKIRVCCCLTYLENEPVVAYAFQRVNGSLLIKDTKCNAPEKVSTITLLSISYPRHYD